MIGPQRQIAALAVELEPKHPGLSAALEMRSETGNWRMECPFKDTLCSSICIHLGLLIHGIMDLIFSRTGSSRPLCTAVGGGVSCFGITGALRRLSPGGYCP